MPALRRSKLDLVLSRKPIVRPPHSRGSGGPAVARLAIAPTGLRTRMRAMRVSLSEAMRLRAGEALGVPAPQPCPASYNSRPTVIALDLGTSSARASLYDAGGRAVEGRFHQGPYPPTRAA